MTEWRRVSISPYHNYEVSADGQVRRGGRILRPLADRYGYERLGLYYAGLRQQFKVHRIVCEAWHGPAPGPAHEVCHIDGNKANNTPTNLRWGTREENSADSIRQGRFFGTEAGVSGEAHPNAKLSGARVAELRSITGLSQRALAKQFGISQTEVCHILQGKKWTGK